MDKYLGKRLDGRYEIHELIGVGGMANVYRCTDTVDDREVAVKILKDEYLNNEEFIRRFKNESKAIAMLSHPNRQAYRLLPDYQHLHRESCTANPANRWK